MTTGRRPAEKNLLMLLMNKYPQIYIACGILALLFSSQTYAFQKKLPEAVVLPLPSEAQIEMDLEHDATGPDKSFSRVYEIPQDAKYRFDKIDDRYLVIQEPKRANYEANYDPQNHRILINAWAKTAVWPNLYSQPPTAMIRGTLFIHVTKNACDSTTETVGENTNIEEAYKILQRATEGVLCETSIREDDRQEVIHEFDAKLSKKLKLDSGKIIEVILKQAKLNELRELTTNYEKFIENSKTELEKFLTAYRKSFDFLSSEAIKTLAVKIDQSDLSGVSSITTNILLLQKTQSELQNDLLVEGHRLHTSIQLADRDFNKNFNRLSWDAQQMDLSGPQLVSSLLNTLEETLANLESRNKSVADNVRILFTRLSNHESTLRIKLLDKEKQELLTKTLSLEASTRFVEEITASTKNIWKSPALQMEAGLPYLADDYEEKRSFLLYEDTCKSVLNGNSFTWMKTGCLLANTQIQRVKVYIKTILPERLREFSDLKNSDALRRLLDANDLAGAVQLYDSILQSGAP